MQKAAIRLGLLRQQTLASRQYVYYTIIRTQVMHRRDSKSSSLDLLGLSMTLQARYPQEDPVSVAN